MKPQKSTKIYEVCLLIDRIDFKSYTFKKQSYVLYWTLSLFTIFTLYIKTSPFVNAYRNNHEYDEIEISYKL